MEDLDNSLEDPGKVYSRLERLINGESVFEGFEVRIGGITQLSLEHQDLVDNAIISTGIQRIVGSFFPFYRRGENFTLLISLMNGFRFLNKREGEKLEENLNNINFDYNKGLISPERSVVDSTEIYRLESVHFLITKLDGLGESSVREMADLLDPEIINGFHHFNNENGLVYVRRNYWLFFLGNEIIYASEFDSPEKYSLEKLMPLAKFRKYKENVICHPFLHSEVKPDLVGLRGAFLSLYGLKPCFEEAYQ
jgi:hypothetical protein